MNTTKTIEKPALSIIRELGIGDSATFPVKRVSYISSICTRFGLQWGKKFKTAINREDRTIKVTRVE